jgi:hypothetical protein
MGKYGHLPHGEGYLSTYHKLRENMEKEGRKGGGEEKGKVEVEG